MPSPQRETANERIPVQLTPSEKNNIVLKARNSGMTASEYMRRAADAYIPTEDIQALEAMIDKMNEATGNTERAIDDVLSVVAESNARIAKMEQEAIKREAF